VENMEYGLTSSTIKRIKLLNVNKGEEMDYRFVWEVNYANVCGKKLLLIVNADTRYAMIYCDLKPFVWKNITEFISEAIHLALKREDFTEEKINKYFELAGKIKLTTTHGAKACSGLKHLTVELAYYDKTLVDGMFQPIITDDVNFTLCNISLHPEMKYYQPRDFFRIRMNELLK
jgi:hypothetical protein